MGTSAVKKASKAKQENLFDVSERKRIRPRLKSDEWIQSALARQSEVVLAFFDEERSLSRQSLGKIIGRSGLDFSAASIRASLAFLVSNGELVRNGDTYSRSLDEARISVR